MKAKTLLALALLTIPLIHAANPKAATGPRLIKEFVVDELNSVGFTSGYRESTEMVLAYKLDGEIYVTKVKVTPYECRGTDEANYALENTCSQFTAFAEDATLRVVSTEQETPNILSVFVHANTENKPPIPVQFEYPIRSFTLSKNHIFIYVTLENNTTFRIGYKPQKPTMLEFPEHGGILHVEFVSNPRRSHNYILSSSTHPDCPLYFHNSKKHVIVNLDNCQDPKYTSDLSPLSHCLCDVSHSTWALVRCGLPNTLYVYKTQDEKEFERHFDLTSRPSCLVLNTYGDLLVIGYENGLIEMRDIEDHAWKAEFYLESPDEEAQHHYQITTLALSQLTLNWKSEISLHGTMPIYLVVAYMNDADTGEQVLIFDIGKLIADTIRQTRNHNPKTKGQSKPCGLMGSGIL